MTMATVSWAMDQKALKCKQKFVLLVMCNAATDMDGEEMTGMSVARIADATSLSERKVSLILARLVQGGYISRFVEDGDVYRINRTEKRP